MRRSLQAICLMISLIIIGAAATAAASEMNAEVGDIVGKVQVQKKGTADWINYTGKATLKSGDAVRTGRKSNCIIKWSEDNVIKMSPETTLEIRSLLKDGNGDERTGLKLAIGEIIVQAQALLTEDSHFIVRTPTAMAFVKGTRFFLRVGRDGSTGLGVMNGSVSIAARGAEVRIGAYEMIEVDASGEATKATPMTRRVKTKMFRQLKEINRL